jgi:putative nucleotidyltransferase with HDIG domain
MNKLIEFTSVEEKELYKLLAILHDVGKLSTREEKDGKISFHGHAKSGIEIANKILDEIVYKDKELLLFLIEHHMDVFNAIDTGNYEFLAKNDKLYKNIKYLINMAKADIEKNNPEQIEEISQLFKKVEEKRKEIEKKKEEQENKRKLDKEISLEDFIKNLNKKNISKDVKIKAIKGKFKNISDDEVNKFNLNEVMKRIKLLKEDFYLDRELVDAVESGSLNKVKECIKYGADIHVWNDYPLRFAVAEGHFDIVKYLLSDKREDKADIHTVEPYALREALENGHFDIIEYLLDNGVDGTFIEDDEVYKQWEKKKDAENKRKEAEGRWTQADLTEIPIKSVSDQSESERAQTLDLNDIPRTKTSTDQSESDRFKMLDLDEIWRRIKNVK